MTDWQPIDTAPKDRRILLGYPPSVFSGGLRVIFGKWFSDEYAKYPKPYWKHDLFRIHGVIEMRASPPTHWTELPEPPQ